MVNKRIVLGRLGQDPEVRYTQSEIPVATLSVATTEKWKNKNGEMQEETTWHRVVLWSRLAEVAEQYLAKGDLVYIEGKHANKEWEDKDGNTRYSNELVGKFLQMLGGNSSDKSGSSGKKGSGKPKNDLELDENFDDMDDDLPF